MDFFFFHLIRRYHNARFLCFLHSILSGTIPIGGLTNTRNPDSVQPFIDKNIHKVGYEKAVKEFLDEKRKEIQKKQAPLAKLLAPVKMTLRSHGRLHTPSLSVEVTIAVSAKSDVKHTSRLSSNTQRIQNRLRNQVPESEGKTKFPPDLQPNAHIKMMLRSHSRSSTSVATATSAKPNKKPTLQLLHVGVRRSARIAGIAAK